MFRRDKDPITDEDLKAAAEGEEVIRVDDKRQDAIDICQPKELESFQEFYERNWAARSHLVQQGVDAAPMLTVAWAILTSNGIPDSQALNEVISTHEEILARFVDFAKSRPK